MYIYIYIHTYVFMYVCIFQIYSLIYMHILVYMYFMYIHITSSSLAGVAKCLSVLVWTCVCVHASRVYACAYVCIYVSCICVYTYIYNLPVAIFPERDSSAASRR